MSEMAQNKDRMARVPAFYRVIEKYAELAISVQFDLSTVDSAMKRITVPGMKINWTGWRNPYILAFRCLTDVINRSREEFSKVIKEDERIHFIFDDRSEKTKI